MVYRRPIRTIASVGGLYSKSANNAPKGGSIVIVSETPPTEREDQTALEQGDFWYKPSEGDTFIYIEGEWERVVADLTTAELDLANGTQNVFSDVDSLTLPPVGGVNTQEDANLWFLNALDSIDNRVGNLEALPPGGGGGTNFLFKGDAPITVDQQPTSVTHGMDLSNLPEFESANHFVETQKAKRRINNRSINRTVNTNNFSFKTFAPLTVDVDGNDVTHGMEISDLTLLM